MAAEHRAEVLLQRGQQTLLLEGDRSELENQCAHLGQRALGEIVGALQPLASLGWIAIKQTQRSLT